MQSWIVVPVIDQKNRKHHQWYYSNNVGDTHNLNGTRVILTFTMSAMEMTAAPFITIHGLNEREISKETCTDDHLIIAVPKFCAGSTIDVRIREVGYLCFDRSEKSAVNKTSEQKTFEHCRENVLSPFIASARESLFEWTLGTPIPDTLAALC